MFKLYRIDFAQARKPYKIGFQFTCIEEWLFRRHLIYVTKRIYAAPAYL